eukprot:TRINITY_DN27737_c0_g2_i1.p1 TRINITY_DN27737_c0_g2~~TRINITY_DN27737_c0_g2_i1.p1  ORF type:complete len:231 (-),score=28.00 TRINITY_DN27737_c0_g2_i1:16-708(-)
MVLLRRQNVIRETSVRLLFRPARWCRDRTRFLGCLFGGIVAVVEANQQATATPVAAGVRLHMDAPVTLYGRHADDHGINTSHVAKHGELTAVARPASRDHARGGPLSLLMRREAVVRTDSESDVNLSISGAYMPVKRPEDISAFSCSSCWKCGSPPQNQRGPDDEDYYCICGTQSLWAQNTENSDDVEVNMFCNSGEACKHSTIPECRKYDNSQCTCDASYKWKIGTIGR